jgi:hypothetical protein
MAQNLDLPSVAIACEHCKAALIVQRRLVQGKPRESPACPKCRQPCRKTDDGKRKDKHGKEYVQFNRIEITSAVLKNPREVAPGGSTNN